MTTKTVPRLPCAILFDLDGTLADTAPDLAAAVNLLRTARGLAPTPYEILRPTASSGARGLIGAAFGLTPEDEGYETLRIAFLHNYASALSVKSRLFDGVTELIHGLGKHNLAWGIVTNKAACFTDPLVNQIGLHAAGCVVSGDTTPQPKPHPGALLEAARRLGLPPQDCWYVGDDIRDIQAGQAAGMHTVAAAWGYCGEIAPHTWNAGSVADTPLQLLEYIRQRVLR